MLKFLRYKQGNT